MIKGWASEIQNNMRILGIDPGYERIGVAILEKETGHQKEQLVFSDCLITSRKDSVYKRLETIGNQITELCEKYQPTICGIENLFLANNHKTAFRVAEAKGVIAYSVTCQNIPIFEYTPLQIKQAVTGYGKATKDQVGFMVQNLFKINVKEKIDDEVDAIAVAFTTSSHYRPESLLK